MFKISNYTDIALVFGVIFILALMLIPLPTWALDFFLAINITSSMLVLILSLYIKKPLDLSIFPSLLLFLTLYRLALNISSTRLILLEANAGQIIQGFGTFVVGGNYVVGFIIFLILVIIQFVVIVKGSGRISEVAARFTLDAMPGKQMAIDADLNTGLINETEAKARRAEIAREAEFYGAMDGASKFVKGDAIAGIVITLINIIGGFIIGIAQKGMDLVQALETYTILTIGDGLVSQIPSLIIATSAGIVITRTTEEKTLDAQFKIQLFSNYRALGALSGMLALFALIPGMPMLPFLFLSVSFGGISYIVRQQSKIAQAEPEPSVETLPPQEDKVEQYLQVDPIEIEIGYGLISIVDESQGGNLFQKIAATRKYLALQYGVLIPPIRVRDNLQLGPNEYVIKIKGIVEANYTIYTDRYLALNPGSITEKLSGLPTVDPAFGLQGYWISYQEKDRAELLGYTVVDAMSVLTTHLQEVLKKNFDKILTRQAVKSLIENLKKDYSAVVEEINQEQLSLGTIQKVLQNLLKEQIPIRDLELILEALIDYSKVTKNVDVLTEYVRHSLGDVIANLYKDANGTIRAAALDSQLEDYFVSVLQKSKDISPTLGLTHEMMKTLNLSIKKNMEYMKNMGLTPIIICSATVRPYFYKLINAAFPDVVVLSYTELPSDTEIEFVGKIEAANAN